MKWKEIDHTWNGYRARLTPPIGSDREDAYTGVIRCEEISDAVPYLIFGSEWHAFAMEWDVEILWDNCAIWAFVDFGYGPVEIRCTKTGRHRKHKCEVTILTPTNNG